ncbi:ribosome maturation protein SDO1 [Enteropsectra breve]|nr:ribosome maturation protein SDO1 [Enteropsectra breve]
MLVRDSFKRLTNVSIVSLKRNDRRYELAVYPNKLYEYQNNRDVPLSEILHSDTIFRNAMSGDVISSEDRNALLAEISKDNSGSDALIHYILQQGREQKPKETAQHELENTERQLVDLVQKKVKYNGSFVTKELLAGFIRKVYDVKNGNAKKQLALVTKRLVEMGFERIRYRVVIQERGDHKEDYKEVHYKEVHYKEVHYKEVHNKEQGEEAPAGDIAEGCESVREELQSAIEQAHHSDTVLVRSDVLPYFVKYCSARNDKIVIQNEEDLESEEIC